MPKIKFYYQVHLFDIDIPGKLSFLESSIVSPGDCFTTFDTRKIYSTKDIFKFLYSNFLNIFQLFVRSESVFVMILDFQKWQ